MHCTCSSAVNSTTSLFSLPDRNVLWNRVEDDLLVQSVSKDSTSEVLFPNWSVVVSELTGWSNQEYKESYRLPDTVVELTFVCLCVTFRGPPFLRSSHVLTKDTDSVDSGRPIHYSTYTCSETDISKCVWQQRWCFWTLSFPVDPLLKLTYLSVYDSRNDTTQCMWDV